MNPDHVLDTAVRRAFPSSDLEKHPSAGGWVLAITRKDFDPKKGPAYRDELFEAVHRQPEGGRLTIFAASFAPSPLEHYSKDAILRTRSSEQGATISSTFATSRDLYVRLHFVDAESLLLDAESVKKARAILDPNFKQAFHSGPFRELEFDGVPFLVRAVEQRSSHSSELIISIG